ncbi:MAG: CHC2 zinc finger domain-containing protein [Planctomycetia bacterium]|nr:CHC2 zinc finger domain-containing protein [Planctomycetia bacterium]
MLYGFSLDVKEQIRQTINIVDLIGEYVQLTPRGRVYVGLCPWHDDSKPSLQVDPERQTFRCWVCADGGDIFSFMMKMENVSFPEAMQMLAERAGVELPKTPKRHSQHFDGDFSSVRGFRKNSNQHGDASTESAAGVSESADYSTFSGKKKLHESAKWAELEYHNYFKSLPETHPARVYLSERGITPENVDKFQIGFAPDEWNWLERRASRKSGLLKDLNTTGYLGYSEERKSYYERFRGRLLFPIHDAQGRSVGIGGRVIPGVPTANESAKYLNTPETPLFSKHRLLYGLDLARNTIQKKKRVLVMEGYTDTIIAHQYGFTESVAVLGTALGLDHIRILNRLANTIYLVLDGDEAGKKRAAQVLELFVAEKVDVQILTLPENNDPAEYLAEFGAEKFEDLLQNHTNDALTHAFNLYTSKIEFNNIHQSEQALDKLLGLIASGSTHGQEKDFGLLTFREEKMLQQLSFSFSISEEFIRRRLKEIRSQAQRAAFMRESWQQRREEQEKVTQGILPENMEQGKKSNSLLIADESEAYMDDEYAMYDVSFDPSEFGVTETGQNKTNLPITRPRFSENDTEDEPEIDYTAEPSLLTRELFEQYADEVDWRIFGRMNAWEKEIAEILLKWPHLISAVRGYTTPERFLFVPARELFLRMCEMADEEMEPSFERVLNSFESKSMKSWIVQLDAESVWHHERKTEEQVLLIIEQIMANSNKFYTDSRRPQDMSLFHSASLNRDQKLDLLDQLWLEKKSTNAQIFGQSKNTQDL